MSFIDLIRSSLSNLRRRKLRSSLTIFAVIIGASLVSLLVSIGLGMEAFLTSQVRSVLPADVVIVSSNRNIFQSGLGSMGLGTKPEELSEKDSGILSLQPIALEDTEKIKSLEYVERVDPYVILFAESARLQDSDKRFRTRPRTLPIYWAEKRQLVAGSYLTEQSRGECIIANQYLEVFRLQSPEEALGKVVEIEVAQTSGLIGLPSERNIYSFEIVGVTEKTLSSTEIIIPLEDGKEMARFWSNNPDLYTDKIPPPVLQVKLKDSQAIPQVVQEVEELGLGATTSSEVLGLINTIFGIMEAVLAAFGLIALGVASLGIINTLIMAVHERIKEIGVMKAVGASKGTIRTLFMAEGATIGFLGGIIGVAISYALSAIIDRISRNTFLKDFETFNISIVPWWLIVGVIALTTMIALISALYPAARAASLDPIESLRYE